MEVNPEGSAIDFRFAHPKNAESKISLTAGGISMETSPVQSWNADTPTEVVPSGNATETSFVQF